MDNDQQNTSLWIGTTPETAYPRATGSVSVDVAVVGGGITGLTTALLLKRAGVSVAVIESRRVALGTTGNTTAKVTSLHRVVYQELEKALGEDAARAYGEANQTAVELVAAIANEHGIECDLRRIAAYTYAESEDGAKQVRDEAELTQRLGLPGAFTESTSLPFPVQGAVRFGEQLLFHPRKYALGLAALIPGGGSHLFEESRAAGIDEVDGRYVVEVDGGATVEAGHVVIATLLPFHDPGGLFAKASPSRSYALAAKIEGALPDGMFLNVESPTRSVRPHISPEGEWLVVEGEEHKTGQDDDMPGHYEALEAWARERFPVRSIDFRWSAQDYMTPDHMPYVGRATPGSDRLLVASGFNKWGMSNGTAAAMILRDHVLGRENPWAELFDATRLNPTVSAPTIVKENLNVAKRFIGDRVAALTAPSLDELKPGEGAVVDLDGDKVAAYRHADGTVHAVSAICTHLGCTVKFNAAETTWDCPCHGSRFGTDGRVIEGPANRDLEPRLQR